MRGNTLDRLIQLFYQMGYRIFLCLWFFTRPDTRGAYVAVWSGNRILIIKNSYRKIFTCPSGALKRGESYLAAAVRELYEEVGLSIDPKDLKPAGRFFSQHEFKKDTIIFFEAHFLTPPRLVLDNREVVWGEFMNPEEALKLPLSPHVKTLSGRVCKYRHSRSFKF